MQKKTVSSNLTKKLNLNNLQLLINIVYSFNNHMCAFPLISTIVICLRKTPQIQSNCNSISSKFPLFRFHPAVYYVHILQLSYVILWRRQVTCAEPFVIHHRNGRFFSGVIYWTFRTALVSDKQRSWASPTYEGRGEKIMAIFFRKRVDKKPHRNIH